MRENEDLVRRFVEACRRTRTILPAALRRPLVERNAGSARVARRGAHENKRFSRPPTTTEPALCAITVSSSANIPSSAENADGVILDRQSDLVGFLDQRPDLRGQQRDRGGQLVSLFVGAIRHDLVLHGG